MTLGHSPRAHESADPVQSFLDDLRTLRVSVGAPSYRTLAKATELPRSTVHDALNIATLPSLDVTLAIVRALQGDPDSWRDRWIDTRAAVSLTDRTTHQDTGAPPHEPGVRPEDTSARPESTGDDEAATAEFALPENAEQLAEVRTTRKRWMVRTALVLAAAITAAAVGFVIGRQTAPRCTAVALYQLTDDSRLLAEDGTLLSAVDKGELAEVRSTDHGPFRYRVEATLVRTGAHGWVDQGKIRFVANSCA